MHLTARRSAPLLFAIAAVLLLAGCSGGTDDGPSPLVTATPCADRDGYADSDGYTDSDPTAPAALARDSNGAGHADRDSAPAVCRRSGRT